MPVQSVGELQPKKRRRLEDEEESQGENWKEKPVKMEPTWSREEDSLFCDIMKDLRKRVILPELNPEYDYWNMEIWDFIAGMYNDRASVHNFRMRSALDILLHGESVKAQFATQRAHQQISPILDEVFSPCVNCKRIPIFPRKLINQAGHYQVAQPQRVSGNSSGVQGGIATSSRSTGSASGSFGSDRYLLKIADLIRKGLLSSEEAAKVVSLSEEWVNKTNSAWINLIDAPIEDALKANMLKARLHI